MTPAQQIVDILADSLGLPRKITTLYARRLRENGYLPVSTRGRGGVGGALIGPKEAANLLLGIIGSDTALGSVDAVNRLGGMYFANLSRAHYSPGSISNVSVVDDDETGAEIVQILEEDAPYFFQPFSDFLATIIDGHQSGIYSGMEYKPTRLTVSRSRPAAIFEFNVHANIFGGALFGEVLFLGGDDIKQPLIAGDRPSTFERTMPVMESFAAVPGTIFQELADVLNEAEERSFLRPNERVEQNTASGA